jgi:LmbE family N-acetylglucosaminyl deacetylase
MNPDQHLIVVAPHPDDETLGLGGTIHDHLRGAGSAEIIAVTDGEAADDMAGREARAAVASRRQLERRTALALLGAAGVSFTRLRFPDRDVALHEPRLAEALRQGFLAASRVHTRCLVALPWRDDPHADHRAAARAAIDAAAGTGLDYVEIPIWAWYDRRCRQRLPPSRVRSMTISPSAREAKRAALRCFTSQLEPLPGGRGPVLPSDFLEAFAGDYELILE